MGPPLGGLLTDLSGSYRAIFFFAPLWIVLGLLLLGKRATPLTSRP